MKIQTSSTEIFQSGTVMSFKKEPIEFFLLPDLKILFSFLNDKEKKEHSIIPIQKSPKEVEIQLINFNNVLGTGTTEPLQIGTLNKRKLFLNFIVYTLGEDQQKTFNYTYYLGEEVSDGK